MVLLIALFVQYMYNVCTVCTVSAATMAEQTPHTNRPSSCMDSNIIPIFTMHRNHLLAYLHIQIRPWLRIVCFLHNVVHLEMKRRPCKITCFCTVWKRGWYSLSQSKCSITVPNQQCKSRSDRIIDFALWVVVELSLREQLQVGGTCPFMDMIITSSYVCSYICCILPSKCLWPLSWGNILNSREWLLPEWAITTEMYDINF